MIDIEISSGGLLADKTDMAVEMYLNRHVRLPDGETEGE
jgi:hypothetical protein